MVYNLTTEQVAELWDGYAVDEGGVDGGEPRGSARPRRS
jgi:hypothetical protein